MLLDPSVAKEAVELALPMIEPAVASHRVGASGFLYLVVMDPLKPSGSGVRFEDAVLYEHAVGDPAHWDADYAGFARAKAELSWQTGLSGSEVQQQVPYLLRPGDTLLEGGVADHGMVVAVSGSESWFDEALAHVVIDLCRALSRERRQRLAASGALTLDGAGAGSGNGSGNRDAEGTGGGAGEGTGGRR